MPQLRTHRILFAALALVLFVLVPASALAQTTRTVVLRFEGWRAEQARSGALEGLVGTYEIVEEGTLIDTAARIGVDVSTPEGMAAVVENLGVTLVIGGFVEGTGRRATTTVWVMDVRGNELARRQTSGPGARGAAQDIAASTAQAAQEALSVLNRPPPEPEPPVDEAPPDRGMEHEAPPSHEEPVDVSGRWNQPLIRALVGLRIRNRAIGVSPNALDNRFDADFFPDLQLQVEARPLAMDPGALRGLYFALSMGISAGMTYLHRDVGLDASDMMSFNLEVDAGYGLVLAELVELVLSLGVGVDGFDLTNRVETGPLADFPATAYSYVRPAIQGRIRIVPDDLLIAELGFGGRIVWDSGGLQEFGPTGTSAGGIDFSLGLAGIIDPGFSWAARFAYTAYFLGFSGGTAESATDEALQIWLLVGWSF